MRNLHLIRQRFGNRDRSRVLNSGKYKILDPTIEDSCKIYNMEMTIEEEVIDIKIIAKMKTETEGDKTLGEVLVMTELD